MSPPHGLTPTTVGAVKGGSSSALSPRAVWLSSVLVLVLHAAYCGCYSYETRQYLTQARVDGVVQNYIYRLLGLGALPPRTISYTLSVTSSLIAAWHGAGLVRALRASLHFRRLLLDVPEEKILHRLKTKIIGRQSAETLDDGGASTNPSFHRRWAGALKGTFVTYLTMDGEHFETGTNLRKSLELGTQINLMIRMSRLVAEPALNDLIVAVFTVNCWATPLIRWHFRHTRDRLPGRLNRHIVGLILAGCFTIAVPGAIWGFVMPLVPDRALRFEKLMTTRVRLLLRHVMISNWSQVVSTRLAACMAILAIETLKKKLHIASQTARADAAKVHVTDANNESNINHPKNERARETPGRSRRLRQRLPWLRVGLLFDVLWFFTGLVVLGIHIQARSPKSLAPGLICRMPLRPWAQSKPACAVLEINCHRGAAQGGTVKELDALLQGIDPTTVSSLAFTHCAALAMPPRLQTFSDIAMLEIYNSTVVRWDADAALSTRHHKFLGTVWLFRVTGIAELPLGLLDTQFPAADVLISHSDLAALPDDLADRWPRDLSKIAIEHSRLTVVPRALLDGGMSALAISFAGNDLAEVPPRALQQRAYFRYVSFAENPRLAALPDVGWSATFVDWRGTSVSRVPHWMADPASATGGVVFGGSSPVCATGASTLLPSGMFLECTSLTRVGVTGGGTSESGTGLVPLAELALERLP